MSLWGQLVLVYVMLYGVECDETLEFSRWDNLFPHMKSSFVTHSDIISGLIAHVSSLYIQKYFLFILGMVNKLSILFCVITYID